MEIVRGFEEDFRRRLRAELDDVVARAPGLDYSPRHSRVERFWIARPLALALIAALALGFLAASVTRSPDPAQWVQPAVWARALGVAPPPPAAVTTPPPAQVGEDAPSTAPAVTEHPSATPVEPSQAASSEPAASPAESLETSTPTDGAGG